MKIRYFVIFIILLACVAPSYADYKSLQEELSAYQPPKYFSESLKFKAGDSEDEKLTDDTEFSAVIERISRLKTQYDDKIKNAQSIKFLANYDPALFQSLTKISKNHKSVKALIQKRITLEEVEILSALRNPAILAAKAKVKAEIESYNQIMDLDENLRQYSAFAKGISIDSGPLKMKDSIKSKYPYPGQTALKGQIINSQVAIALEKFETAQKDIITKMRTAYWDLVFIEKSTEITFEIINAFDRLKSVATILYKSGKTSFQDVIKVNIKIAVLKENLVTLTTKKRNAQILIIQLLDLSSDTKTGRPAYKHPDYQITSPEKLYPLARQNNQALKILRHKISKLEKMVEMSESMILSPFILNLSAYGGDPVQSTGAGAQKLSFPEKTMPSGKNNAPVRQWYAVDDPWLRQTKQNLSSLKKTLVNEEHKTDSNIQVAWFNVDKNKRELYLYQNLILELSKSALDVSTREYESGITAFSEAIDSYTSWLKVKLLIAQKHRDLCVTVAKLENIIGKSF